MYSNNIILGVDTISAPNTKINWSEAIQRIWQELPNVVKDAITPLNILVVTPTDYRLNNANAATSGNDCIISIEADPKEIVHEIGHRLVSLLLQDDLKQAEDFYDFNKDSRSPHDVLAEDFYFFITNNKQSPFWEQWLQKLENDKMHSINKNSVTKRANVSPLQLVEAVLDELAILVLNAKDERLLEDWGIAKDALKAAQVQDQLSYENTSGPRQYYYSDDTNREDRGPKTVPMKQPLEVSKPDVSIREMSPGGGSMS